MPDGDESRTDRGRRLLHTPNPRSAESISDESVQKIAEFPGISIAARQNPPIFPAFFVLRDKLSPKIAPIAAQLQPMGLLLSQIVP
jgi:hypothetical protein